MRATRDKHRVVLLPWLGLGRSPSLRGDPCQGLIFPALRLRRQPFSKSLLSLFQSFVSDQLCGRNALGSGWLRFFLPFGRREEVTVLCASWARTGGREMGPGLRGFSPGLEGGLPPICNPRTYTSHRHTAPLISHTHSLPHILSHTPPLTPHTHSPLPTPHIPHMHTHPPSHTLQHICSQTPHHSHRRHTHSHTHRTICSTDSHPITHAHTPSTHDTHTLCHTFCHTHPSSHIIYHTPHTHAHRTIYSHTHLH